MRHRIFPQSHHGDGFPWLTFLLNDIVQSHDTLSVCRQQHKEPICAGFSPSTSLFQPHWHFQNPASAVLADMMDFRHRSFTSLSPLGWWGTFRPIQHGKMCVVGDKISRKQRKSIFFILSCRLFNVPFAAHNLLRQNFFRSKSLWTINNIFGSLFPKIWWRHRGKLLKRGTNNNNEWMKTY
jgi:hypothetical protein